MVNAKSVLEKISREVTHDGIRKALVSSWGKKITPNLWFQKTFSRQELEDAGISADTRYANLTGRLVLMIKPLKGGRYLVRMEFGG